MRMTARHWNCTPRPASRRCASQALATAALGTHDHSGRHARHCSRLKQPCACNHGGRHARPLRPGQTTLLACRILASASVLTANARSERASSVQRKPRRHALVRIHDTAATPSEGLSCTDPTAVGTHDQSDRHARHCSWLNRCIPAVASARGHRQCQNPGRKPRAAPALCADLARTILASTCSLAAQHELCNTTAGRYGGRAGKLLLIF